MAERGIEMKYDKRYWKRLTESLNSWSKRGENGYRDHRKLQVEHTGFFSRHIGDRGPNHNESGLLDFGKRIFEAKAVYFAAGAQEYFTRVFIDATVHGPEAGTYLELRKGGKTYSVTLYDRADDKLPWPLKECIGPLHLFMPEEYARFVEYEQKKSEETVVNIFTKAKGEGPSERELQQRFEERHVSEFTDLFQHYAQDQFQTRLKAAGIKILVFFRFTHQLQGDRIPHHGGEVKTSYVKTSSRGVELGWYSSGTYNGLPNVVRITKTMELPTVKLHTIGLERSGYYDHHFRCSIPKTQADAAKAFFAKRFASSRGAK